MHMLMNIKRHYLHANNRCGQCENLSMMLMDFFIKKLTSLQPLKNDDTRFSKLLFEWRLSNVPYY